MEHDLEEGALMGEEGKKRARGEMEVPTELGEGSTSVVRNRRVVELGKSHMKRERYNCGYPHGVEVDPEGMRRGLCLAWRKEICVTLKSFSKRHIDVLIDDSEVSCEWRFTGFYGSPYAQDRDASWTVLRNLSTGEGIPWMVCGDFNEIMYGFEKKERITSR
ncbi:hypothetical protein PVK06_015921 [Gossypium arboreum]|uniref:Reverse transcriptase n=1 Tax=Gossypium arboreum TaxID=29729 RepID=A0ABR0PYQ7_GOSAR|nr:hypothetical protein PVK06_015921 [Gossypium arboreum]